MWWIILIVALAALVFLWMIVHSAARSVDDDTQARLDEEQTRAVTEYQKEREEKKYRQDAVLPSKTEKGE